MDNKRDLYAFLLERVDDLAEHDGTRDERLGRICQAVADGVASFEWVGIYWADAETRTLTLGPFAGPPTEHVRIPFGRGVCGQVADREATLVVDDVTAEENYLACNLTTRSEMVVPLFRAGEMIGQLDVDARQKAAFGPEERDFVEAVARRIAALV